MWECAATAGNVYHTRFNCSPLPQHHLPLHLSHLSPGRVKYLIDMYNNCAKKHKEFNTRRCRLCNLNFNWNWNWLEIKLKIEWNHFVLFQQIVQESRIINDESVKCKSRTNILFCGFCWLFCEFRLFLYCLFGLTWILVRILRKSPRIKNRKKQAAKTQLAPAKQCELVSVSNLSEFSWLYFNNGSVDYRRRDVHHRRG